MRMLLLATIASVLLAGCERPARSVSYFETHEPERQNALTECKSGELRGHECETAAEAQAKATTADAEARFRARLGSK